MSHNTISKSGNSKTEESKKNLLTESCDLSTYQSATIVGPADFPFTSPSGVVVSAATVNVGTLNNITYSCGPNSFSTAPTAWWIDQTLDTITLTFSIPVSSFSVVINGSNNGEIFYFNSPSGSITLGNYCTQGYALEAPGNALRCVVTGATGTLITVNNTTASTEYKITHNGAAAGARISLLDCFVGDPLPVVDPVDNIEVCGTTQIPQITFSGTSGATFNWTNNNTNIGLAASGSGNIASFMAANVSSQQVATVTVTPVLGAETGSPVNFTITIKPKPTLNTGSITQPSTCGGNNGSIAFTTTNLPNGIYSLIYTGSGSPENVIVSGNSFLLSGLSAGAYSNFSITNNACTGNAAGPVNLADPSYTWYRDIDGDGFGNPAVMQMACNQPAGYVANNTDCDDSDPLERPGQVWYKDTDNDGYAQMGAATITQCLRPTGYKAASELTSTTGDCNDNNGAINPGAAEICDGINNDCDGSTDEGCLLLFTLTQITMDSEILQILL
ncbi:MAG: putative metal-binding motif-containing protein [Saprospiraceae bacterium]|nr:putative metal-binding motif-containing protein [Saprospiraceae bacterium]